ncbi:MAG TPA: ATP-dependent Clp protease proteolytic subunit [Candidatus Paceibacterota bacterium]|nr:ATP-dependent Clp protease proteolytic subunit [Candidatus Paceibacterota bacterium]
METKDILDEKNHVILLKGRITNELADKFLFALDKLTSRLVPVVEGGILPSLPSEKNVTLGRLVNVVIDSIGGSVDAGARITNALAKLTEPDCHVTGLAAKASSVAFLILQSCLLRTAMRGERKVLYIHRMEHSLPGHSLREFPKEVFRAERTRYEFIAWRTDKKLKEIYDLANAKTYFTADEALAHNFLDFVWEKPPPFIPKGVFIFI